MNLLILRLNAAGKASPASHSVPCIAGVIGTKKFIYDLWGYTVNIASRMESHGIPGCIQVAEATYQILKDKFLFQERGLVEIKGKGQMLTYLMMGKKVQEFLNTEVFSCR